MVALATVLGSASASAAVAESSAPVTPLPVVEEEHLVRSTASPPTTAVPDQVRGDEESQYFLLHELNYFAARVNEGAPPEVKFQVSVRFKMLRLGEHKQHAVNFAYSQTTYWDLFDTKNSEPVRELNYRPEFFYSYQGHEQRYREVQVGYLHDSNGLGVLPQADQSLYSRGWNTFFAQGRWGLSRAGATEPWFYPSLGLRLWWPFYYSKDLEKHMGYGELSFDVDLSVPHHPRIGRLTNRLIVHRRSVEEDLLYPIVPPGRGGGAPPPQETQRDRQRERASS
jgi:outer membrane phospholipase A